MSVLDLNQIDGMALTNSGNAIVMLIVDHLDWEDEYAHLISLQNKINAYVSYIEEKEYMDIDQVGGEAIRDFVIEIAFNYVPTDNATKFLRVVQNQISHLNISVQYETDE